MNKWEKLLLLKSRPNCDANRVLSQNERAQKTYLWCHTRLINFSKKNQPIIFWPFELLVGLTIETKNVIASILGSYLQERNNDEKITQCLYVETLACFSMKHMQ